MRLLLDTHIFFWMATNRSRILPELQKVLEDPEHAVVYSAVVSWEIATKRAVGKLAFSGSPADVAKRLGLEELLITAQHCEAAAELDRHHKDPFDRLLVAQAQTEGLILVTADSVMERYNIPLLRNR